MRPMTASELLQAVRREKPRGWRRFTREHAERVCAAVGRREPALCVPSGAYPGTQLHPASIKTMAEQVRTDNGAVGGVGVGTVIGWLAWKLVEAAVWWAIQRVWQAERAATRA